MEEKLVQRLEAAVGRLEALSAGFRSSASADHHSDSSSDPSIVAFDDLRETYVARLSTAAHKIGGVVLTATEVLEESFSILRDLLVKTKQYKKPDLAGLAEFVKPLKEVVAKVTEMTEGRRSDYYNHLKATADSLGAVFWVAYAGKDCGMSLPISLVEESWQMAEFYSNKVLVGYKNKDQDHIEWAKALKELYLPGLRDYVKNFYPLGPVWSATAKTSISAPSAQPKSPSPVHHAPPPPSGSLVTSGSGSSQPKEGLSAVFQEISSSQNVTAGLRKVTDDMKTKNRADRTGVVGTSEKEAHTSASSFSKPHTSAPSKLELQMGRKWLVENHIGNKNLVIDKCDSKQSVYVFGCKDSVLQIKGKVNNITIDKCNKMGLLFQDVVAACEVVNCNGVEVQCQGSVPTISVDNTGGCQLYLSKDSLGASITTAKSSEINVLIPGAGSGGDWEEHALPQQHVHLYKDGQFVTTPVSHSGG